MSWGRDGGNATYSDILPDSRQTTNPTLPPTPTTTLVELREAIESFAQSMDEEVKQAVRGIRSRARACLGRNGAAFEGRQ